MVERVSDKDEAEGSIPSTPTNNMTVTSHILTGAVLATTTNSFPVAFLLGFVSHFVLDAIPHLDPGTFFNISGGEDKPWPAWVYIFAILEFIIIVVIFYILFHNRTDFAIISVGALGGIFVDILDNNPLIFIHRWPIFKQLHWFHEKIHFNLPAQKWYWGLVTQLVIIGGTLWYLLKF